ESYGWDYILIDGHNEKQIFKALKKVQKAKKPTVISCKTKIGYGSPNKSGTASVHGSPLGKDEVALVRKKLKWNYKPFEIPKNIMDEWRKIGKKASQKSESKKIKDNKKFKNTKNLSFTKKIQNIIREEKQNYIKSMEPMATRKSSEKILNVLTKKIPELIGGSADLAGSNNTKTSNHKIIKPGNFQGNYIHYGVREHAMSGIMNGIALHSNLIPYGGTFLIFSDYCRPSIRLSALMGQRVIYVMTHDSIGLGEDGPTHQPVEQLSSLRSVPNLNVFRPADTIETFECWEMAFDFNTPSIIALSRQKINPIRKEYDAQNKSMQGAYEILRTNQEIKLTILATGSEVNLAVEVSHKLATQNIYSKVISVPSFEIFNLQTEQYKRQIMNETKHKISIEAGVTEPWKKYVGENGICFGVDDFGKSAPGKDVFQSFYLYSDYIVTQIKAMLDK
nr:transketolase [Pelagibacterales bacterium]